eukprot:15327730-Ditylum_brightwellii.AAC.1
MYYQKVEEELEEYAKGMRVKLTFCFTGAGQTLAPYVTVSGLTERELLCSVCPSGIHVIKIPGLAMERARDPECQKIGYAMLLCKGVSLESVQLKNHEHYHNKVYRPAINHTRKTMHGCDVESVSK